MLVVDSTLMNLDKIYYNLFFKTYVMIIYPSTLVKKFF